jgi:hypothetical protein
LIAIRFVAPVADLGTQIFPLDPSEIPHRIGKGFDPRLSFGFSGKEVHE